MRMTLCGSIAFIDEMLAIQQQLEKIGHEVKLPPTEIINGDGIAIPAKEYYTMRKERKSLDGWVLDRKEEAMRRHFDKVVWSDAILIVNHDKNAVPYYIGANTLMEMALAFHEKKKIFLLHPIPQMAYTEEIEGMKPIIIHGDLSIID